MVAAEGRPAPARILLLEDSALDAELITAFLGDVAPTPEVRRVSLREDYAAALEGGEVDLILADFSLPDFDGLAALDMARELAPHLPFIFVSGVLGEEVAIESFRRGATDYILKQRLIRLPAAVERALAEAREKAERLRAERQKEVLVRELSHRVKNTMAMVMSLVRRTLVRGQPAEDYVANLLQRLGAMADAHALLFETNWSETDLLEVVRRTMQPYLRTGIGQIPPRTGPGQRPGPSSEWRRIEIKGGTLISLSPKPALALSMVFNELATNAVKHGALAHEGGRVVIDWQEEANEPDHVRIVWQEINGPAVERPQREGFGTTLIKRSVEYELQGSVQLLYRPTGFVCEIVIPRMIEA
ncbi:hypothetical protein BJF93_18470 [Xaviernesmea oryzae]|uniref:histidine kinase n=1 Tax=Xaviernesmea oryzae TaxID=464029 RepID=A0A1Q9B2H1_9HYPH|nr:HWE histidine kinase domain-containing protein [Xaviernesmea oryzae]OLP62209.1 hypothetical protein BJF93_18470 [Xaviernesmea oryzae]SEL91904.1 Two-component sensor histidine kinase, contains HisKA and HATPase domains [Xaviernesmea oryzae]